MNDEAKQSTALGLRGTPKLNDGLILLIEDNIDDIELTLRAFRQKGFTNRIVTLRDGVQALDYLRRHSAYAEVRDPWPSLVLLDLKLPLVDGLEVLEQLKSDPQLRALPVVMLTSSRHERDVNSAYRLGANSYVCKPTDFMDFLEVISKLGNYWLGVVEMPSGQSPPDITRSH